MCERRCRVVAAALGLPAASLGFWVTAEVTAVVVAVASLLQSLANSRSLPLPQPFLAHTWPSTRGPEGARAGP
eukprot:8458452-Alexandrium_andersonii.AAC.1